MKSVTDSRKQSAKRKKKRKEARRWTQWEKHVFSERCVHVCAITVTTNEETEGTFKCSIADFRG